MSGRDPTRDAVPGDYPTAPASGGATSLFNAVNPPWVEETLRARGFADTGVESTLKGVTGDDAYYRNCYHTPGYIRETWGQDFEVLETLPAFVANMQDLVFLTPRA